jgi:aryl-alcohol dehydrogenase-like predicted oxidoreductase
MADFGFGTYRISDLNQSHIDVLREAVKNGIDLIDTSTNYFDGGSEKAIAKALKNFDASIKEEIKIVSKFGYIQGSLLKEYLDKNSELSQLDMEVVEYSPTCYHSISPQFVHHQLEASLERLEADFIDCYLIHNPEYYIYDAINKGIDKQQYLSVMYERIFKAFVALEAEAKRGKINSYGISSNSFAKNENDADFLPYEPLIDLAKKAALEVGNKSHSFSTVEFPANIAEKEGLKCSFWAKEVGLRVLVNRPLNVLYNSKMYRLAEYESSRDYYMYLNELLEFCDNELLRSVYNLISDLDDKIYKFEFISDYDSFVHKEVIPHLQKSLMNLDDDSKEKLISYIDMFLYHYRDMVLYEISKKTKNELSHLFRDCNESMQVCALKYLLKQDSIDYVLVGARRMRYLYEILALRESLK